MLERTKAWVKKHPVLTGVIGITVTVAGALIGYTLLSSRKDGEEFNEAVTNMFPTITRRHVEANDLEPVAPEIDSDCFDCFDPSNNTLLLENNDESIIIEVDGVLKSFPRTDFIRHLHEGQRHSVAAAELAAAVGIELEPGQTYVRPTIVNKKVA